MGDGTRAPAGVSPAAVVDAVAAYLVAEGSVTEQSFERLVELMERFAAFVSAGHGVGDLRAANRAMVDEFVNAPTTQGERPSATVRHLRRCAVRMLFRVGRELGVIESDPTMDLGLPARRPPAPRPLTDGEVERCRAASMYDFDGTRLPTAWALAEAGVRTGEMAKVTLGDVDVDGPGLEVAGCRSAMPRRVELTEWGVPQVGRRLARLRGGPAQPLVYEGDGSDTAKQASSCIAISVTLARAGLGDDPRVRPVSVVAWAGRRVYDETGRLEDAMCYLGMRSLDRTARLIGLEVATARAC